MNATELKAVLAAHAKWLASDGGSGADLFGADLSRADLSGADLFGADLSRADLSGAEGVSDAIAATLRILPE